MVTNNQSEELYNGLKELITEYLQNNVRSCVFVFYKYIYNTVLFIGQRGYFKLFT